MEDAFCCSSCFSPERLGTIVSCERRVSFREELFTLEVFSSSFYTNHSLYLLNTFPIAKFVIRLNG